MANRSKRTRKQRPPAERQVSSSTALVEDAAKSGGGSKSRGGGGKRAGERRERQAKRAAATAATSGPIVATRTHGERPRPPWHPLPLSELLILAGAISVIIALKSNVSHVPTTLLVDIAAVSLGTLEVVIREHRSGFRSHTIMLAALPVLIFHSVTILVISIFTTAPRLVNVGLFAVDLALFVLLFRLMRSSFLTARMKSSSRV